ALRTVPGVEIRRSGSVGKLSNISIRGANANQVQVLIDGVRVKSPMSGQVDLSDVSPELIDRIEVIRGAQSTLYGADAMGGVVNNRQYSETSMMALTARTHPVSWWEPELRLGRYLNYLRFTDLPDPAEQCPFPPCEFPARSTVERREAELLNHFHIGKWSTSSVGLEYRDEKGVAQGSTPFEADSDTRSVFFQQQFRFFERL